MKEIIKSLAKVGFNVHVMHTLRVENEVDFTVHVMYHFNFQEKMVSLFPS